MLNKVYFINRLSEKNPFTFDGSYGNGWVILFITNSSEYQMMTGNTVAFTFTVSKAFEGWQFRVMDFVSYQNGMGRNVIMVNSKEEFEQARIAYEGYSIWDSFLRPYDPPVLVHSTTPDSLKNIFHEQMLRSWNQLKKSHIISEEKPIGSLLGDPEDFKNYIMLGSGVSPELVVSSKQKGFICMNENTEYIPGARFYFDTRTLIKNRLLVRDGCHYKVRDQLSLQNALFIAVRDNISIKSDIFTPKSFAKAADEEFKRIN